MKQDREKIKELLEQDNATPVSREEVDAVFRMLTVLEKEDDAIRLPDNFSDKVVRRVIQKQTNENWFGWFGYFAGILGLIICLIVSLVAVDFNLDLGFLKNIKGYSGLFIFGAAFIYFLNIIEEAVCWSRERRYCTLL